MIVAWAGSLTPAPRWTCPSRWTPAGTLRGPRLEWCAASAGPICASHSQGGASALKNARNGARDSGRLKKSEAFKGPRSCTKRPPVDSGFFSDPEGPPGRRHGHPAAVRVEFRQRRGDLRALPTQVALVDLAPLVHDEGHYARLAPVGGIRDEGEARDHVAVDDVVVGPARGGLALRGHHPEEIPVERLGLALGGLSRRSPRPWPRPRGARTGSAPRPARVPVEPVLRAGGAPELLGVLEHAAAVPVLGGVFALGRDVGAAHADRRELVLADSPAQDLVLARRGVEDQVPSLRTSGIGIGQSCSPMSTTNRSSAFLTSLENGRSTSRRPRTQWRPAWGPPTGGP